MLALICLALLGYTGAQTPSSQGCCLSNKFSATLLQLQATLAPNSTTPVIDDGYVQLDYDYENKLSKLEVHIYDRQTKNYSQLTVFNDYPNDKAYTETNGRCFVTKMNGTGVMTPPCVPYNFTLQRTYKLGEGPSAFSVDIMIGTLVGQRVIIHIEPKTCTPIAQSTYGDTADGTRELTSYLFANVQKNQLSSANPFVLSDACKRATPTTVRRSLRAYYE